VSTPGQVKGLFMLILELKSGQAVSLIDESTGQDMLVKFLGLRESKKNCILLGFECPDSVKVLRDTLLTGKNGGRR